MSESLSGDEASAGRAGLVAQLEELERFVARSESEGDALPPEALEMIARLREIVHALDGLTSSMQVPMQGGAVPPAGGAAGGAASPESA